MLSCCSTDLVAVDALLRSEPANVLSRRQPKVAGAVFFLQLFDLAAVDTLLRSEPANVLSRRQPKVAGAGLLLLSCDFGAANALQRFELADVILWHQPNDSGAVALLLFCGPGRGERAAVFRAGQRTLAAQAQGLGRRGDPEFNRLELIIALRHVPVCASRVYR